MLDFDALFKTSFQVRELQSGRVFDAVQMDARFESACPDRFGLREEEVIEETIVPIIDKTTGMVREVRQPGKVRKQVKYFDPEQGHHHGGNVRGKAGDYLLREDGTYFVVPLKDERGVPVFEKRFMRL